MNGRITAEINEAGHMKRTEYDLVGNVKATEDGNRNVTKFSYDFYNRLVSVENAKGDITRYAYDMNGNRVSITNGRGHTTTMEYNARNLVVKRIDHGGRTGEAGKYVYDSAKIVVYDYNPDSTVKSMLDRNGVTTAYTYDTLSRVIKTVAGSEVITTTYDELGNKLTVTNSTGTITRNFDELGRVLTKATDTSGTMVFKYDQNDGLDDGFTAEIMIDAKGHESKQIFDKLGRLTSVIADGKKTDYAYYDNGNKKSVTYYNKAGETYNKISSTEFTYTDDNQVKTMVNKNATDVVLNNYSYSYDSNGNQISKSDEKGTTTYTYDVLNRIASIKEPSNKTTYYSYDPAGNRWKERIIEGASDRTKYYIYNEQNRLESISEFSDEDERESTVFKYDNNGNQLYSMKESLKKSSESETPKFGMFISGQDAYTEHAEELFRSETINRYNELNQLVETTTGPSTIKNTYNGEGLRVSKTVNNKETNYVYVYDKVILELNEYGNETARNVYGHNLASRTITNDSGVEESYMYLYNGHSDVVALLTSSGSVRVSYYYDAFGNVLEKDLKGLTDISNPFGYSGYQYDEETKTYYLNARMYDPFTARFLQEDTYRGRVTDPLSLNLYTYVSNNPVKYYDPSGHRQVAISLGDGGGGNKNYETNKKIKQGNSYKKGSTGTVVKNIQRKLGIDDDGSFGKETEKAVKAFQKANGLKQDGMVGPNTWAALQKVAPLKPKPEPPKSNYYPLMGDSSVDNTQSNTSSNQVVNDNSSTGSSSSSSSNRNNAVHVSAPTPDSNKETDVLSPVKDDGKRDFSTSHQNNVMEGDKIILDVPFESQKTSSDPDVSDRGCAIVCISMITNYYGGNSTGKKIHDVEDTMTAQWNDTPSEFLNNFPLNYSDDREISEEKVLSSIRSELEDGHPVIIRILSDPAGKRKSDATHFVLVYGVTSSGNETSDFLVHDPAKAKRNDSYTLEDAIDLQEGCKDRKNSRPDRVGGYK